MTALISRARDAAMSNFADAIIVLTVTGSIPATLAAIASTHVLNFARRKKQQAVVTQSPLRIID
jgi:hypothetical protein